MQTSAEKTWGAAREHLRSMLSGDTYNLWFAPLRACAQDNHGLVLEVANDFCEVWLKDNYMELLQDVVGVASGRQLEIKFKVASGRAAAPSAPVQAAPAKAKPAESASERHHSTSLELSFNPKNTFESFVV